MCGHFRQAWFSTASAVHVVSSVSRNQDSSLIFPSVSQQYEPNYFLPHKINSYRVSFLSFRYYEGLIQCLELEPRRPTQHAKQTNKYAVGTFSLPLCPSGAQSGHQSHRQRPVPAVLTGSHSLGRGSRNLEAARGPDGIMGLSWAPELCFVSEI